MNNVDFQQVGGFPLETDTLDYMQSAYKELQKLSAFGGDNYILSGCVVTGSNVSNGFVVINGELLPFEGGASQLKVIIKENKANRIFENGSKKDVFYTRYATFGTGLTYINFADLKRIKDIQTIMTELDAKALQSTVSALLDRVTQLERKAAPFSAGGGMVLWQKPFNEIPEGWKEVVNWRGRMPVGWNPDDADFVFAKTGGSKTHTNTIEEMAPHTHTFSEWNGNSSASGDSSGHPDTNRVGAQTNSTGGGLAYSIMNPYRIVIFIEYVGVA